MWVTKKGLQKILLKQLDKLIAKISNYLLADSFSQKDFLILNNIAPDSKIKVLGNGSIAGVNTKLFIPNSQHRKKIREKLMIDQNSFLILYLGRLNKDKGILDLIYSFEKVLKSNINADLLIVGDDEENIKSKILKQNNDFKDRLHFEDFTDKPEQYMAAADLFCLPSYREGFGMAAVEAGSCGLPVITSRIYGLTDAVEEGITGLMHPPGDVDTICNLITKIYLNKKASSKMGRLGRERAISLYDYNNVSLNLLNYLDFTINNIFHKRKRIAIIASTSLSISCFLINHTNNFAKNYDITIITNNNKLHRIEKKLSQNVSIININFQRNIYIPFDIFSLLNLIYIIFINKFDCVLTFTPKGGFLGMIASFICRTKNRIHWFGGQVWANKNGINKMALKSFDKLIAFLSTSALTECDSQKKYLEIENVVDKNYLKVLGFGSISGIDNNRFKPNIDFRTNIRNYFNIINDDVVILYLGRLNKDKGVLDLSLASKVILKKYANVHFLYVGPDEENIKSKILKQNNDFKDRLHFEDFTDKPEQYMAAADLFCLPSYREGFGMAAVEAGSCGLPVITSRIYGLTDAVEEGITGLMHPPGDIEELKRLIEYLINNKKIMKKLGSNSIERNNKKFSNHLIEKNFVNYLLETVN